MLLDVLIFTAFVLPVLIEYGHVDMFLSTGYLMFLLFTGIWSSDNKPLMALRRRDVQNAFCGAINGRDSISSVAIAKLVGSSNGEKS